MWATVVLLTVLAAPVAAFVYGVGFYSLVAWRHRGYAKSDEPPPDGPPLRGNSGMTILWLVVSGVLVVVMLVWGLAELAAETRHPPEQPPGRRHRPAVAVDVLLPGSRQRARPARWCCRTTGPMSSTSPPRTSPTASGRSSSGSRSTPTPTWSRRFRPRTNKLGTLHRPLQPALRPLPLLHVRLGCRRDAAGVRQSGCTPTGPPR